MRAKGGQARRGGGLRHPTKLAKKKYDSARRLAVAGYSAQGITHEWGLLFIWTIMALVFGVVPTLGCATCLRMSIVLVPYGRRCSLAGGQQTLQTPRANKNSLSPACLFVLLRGADKLSPRIRTLMAAANAASSLQMPLISRPSLKGQVVRARSTL